MNIFLCDNIYIEVALADVALSVGALACKVKGHRFDSWSEHMPRLQVGCTVRKRTRGNQSMFPSHIQTSPSLCLPSPLSKINKHVLGWGLKKRREKEYTHTYQIWDIYISLSEQFIFKLSVFNFFCFTHTDFNMIMIYQGWVLNYKLISIYVSVQLEDANAIIECN